MNLVYIFFKRVYFYLELIKQTLIKKNYKIFYSQFGEDRIINELLKKNKKGFYVDVGCYHPKKYSNTFILYRNRKLRGINIDIEEEKISIFKILRPLDINICCPVSSVKKYVKIIKFGNFHIGSYATPIKNIEKTKKNKLLESFQSTKSLNEIISSTKYKNKEIDLLNIDVEGSDFDVLRSINLKKYKPKIIIIESHLSDISKILSSNIYKHLIKFNYKLRSWSFFSLIFVKKKSNLLKQI